MPSEPSVLSHDLSARASHQADRIADLLDGIGSADPQTADIVGFLRTYAETVRQIAPGDRQGAPIDRLADALQMSNDEIAIVLLAGLTDEHEGVARTLRTLHPLGEPHVSVGLVAQLIAGSHEERTQLEALLHDGPAARAGVFRLAGAGGLFERSIVLADSLWGALQGHDGSWPASLARVSLHGPPNGLEEWLERPDTRIAIEALLAYEDATVVLVAEDETIAVSRLEALASTGVQLVAVRLDPDDAASVGLAAIHAALRGARLAVLATDRESPSALELKRLAGPVIVVTAAGVYRPIGARPVINLPSGPISVAGRRKAWQHLDGIGTDEAAQLAARLPIDPAWTAAVTADLRLRASIGPQNLNTISAAVRTRIGISLPSGCHLQTPSVAWDRLVLPDDSRQLLEEGIDRLRLQSQVLDDWDVRTVARANGGIRMLFTGPPGTGKSLAAEAVASRLDTALLIVDLSQVVSKWLGETEKALARVFDAAERAHAVLRFDEADALFSSRTNVSDANDRYANIETAYLLQRLDAFDGMAILTTNLKQNIDRAFLRRMDALVEFRLPELDERLALWTLHLPAERLAVDADLLELAECFEVPGAWIRNACIAASFRAAGADGYVTRSHLLDALQREYQKAARPFPAALGDA